MILIVAAVLAAAVAALAGSSFRAPGPRPALRRPLVPIGVLGSQIVVVNIVPEALPLGVSAAIHVATYLAVGAWLVANRKVPGLWLVGLGGLLNFLAIAVNGGVMPASPAAAERAGIEHGADSFANSRATSDARLGFLGDTFAVPDGMPFANVFSIGDVLLVAGVAVVVLRGRAPRQPLAVSPV